MRSSAFLPCLVLASGLSAAAGAVPAQQHDVGRHFAVFYEFSVPALESEDALREVLGVPGPNGEKVSSESGDSSRVAFQPWRDDPLITGNDRYGDDATLSESKVQQIGAFPETADDLKAAVLGHAPMCAAVTISGGKVEEDLPRIGMWATMPPGTQTHRRDFMLFGALEPEGAVLMGSMGPGSFRLNAFQLERN